MVTTLLSLFYIVARPPSTRRTDPLFHYTSPFRSREPYTIVEAGRRRQPRHRTDRRGGAGVGGRERAAAGDAARGPLDPPVTDDRTLDVGDDAECEAGKLVGLERLVVTPFRSEERRVGKECVSRCRSRWSPYL